MKKTILVLACLILGSVAMADTAGLVEVALIDGGENGRNGAGDQFGIEASGEASVGEHWYVGGILGRFNRDSSGGDTTNTYFNAHGGYLFDVAEDTGVIVEAGLWAGRQSNPGTAADTDPLALEIKAGVGQALSKKFDIFGSLSWVRGDLDTGSNDNLRNYIWSLGAAYKFGKRWGINLKFVNGVNGVNGQDQVIRFAGRYTFGR